MIASTRRLAAVAQRTEWKEWVKKVRAKDPVLVEIGKKPPKLVLSFGGSGFLTTYQCGVAKFLQEERKALLAQSFLLGAGSGVLPAVALACGPSHVNLDNCVNHMCDNIFSVTDEDKRRKTMRSVLDGVLPGGSSSSTSPTDAVQLVNGRLALTVGFSNKDHGYLFQKKENIYYGHHVCVFDNRADLIQCMIAATAPNVKFPCNFRDADNVLRGTFWTMSSELDQLVRHVHIHGYCGYRHNRHQTRHNFYFGRHGFIANTHFSFPKQVALAFFPDKFPQGADALRQAYELGYQDARMYERWEEDPYFYAKPDRSAADDFSWRSLRASLFGGRKGERFDL